MMSVLIIIIVYWPDAIQGVPLYRSVLPPIPLHELIVTEGSQGWDEWPPSQEEVVKKALEFVNKGARNLAA